MFTFLCCKPDLHCNTVCFLYAFQAVVTDSHPLLSLAFVLSVHLRNVLGVTWVFVKSCFRFSFSEDEQGCVVAAVGFVATGHV